MAAPQPFTIPEQELEFRASRSSGPGGQHVNTSSSRIEVVWDIAASPSLRDDDRVLLLGKLRSRIDSDGRLRVVAQSERSQLRNRNTAVARLTEIVRAALVRRPPRRPTKPTAASRRERLDGKRKRSALKRQRRIVDE